MKEGREHARDLGLDRLQLKTSSSRKPKSRSLSPKQLRPLSGHPQNLPVPVPLPLPLPCRLFMNINMDECVHKTPGAARSVPLSGSLAQEVRTTNASLCKDDPSELEEEQFGLLVSILLWDGDRSGGTADCRGGVGRTGVRWSIDLHRGLGGKLYLEHFMILQYPFTLFWNDLESRTFHSLFLK